MNTFDQRLSRKQSPKTKRVTGDITWSLDSDFNIVSWNKHFAEIALKSGATNLPVNFFDLTLTNDQETLFSSYFKKAFKSHLHTSFLTAQLSLQSIPGYISFEKMSNTMGDQLLCKITGVNEEHHHNYLSGLLEKMPAPHDESKIWFWSVDNDGLITSLSQNAENLTGYNNKERIGNHVLSNRSEKEQKDLLKFWDSYVKFPRPFDNLFTRFTAKDGTHMYIKASGVPRYDAKGNLTGFSGTMTDVTLEKELHEKLLSSEQLNRSIVETLPDSFMILTAEGILLDYHPHNAEEDLGLTQDNIGESVDGLLKTKKADFLIAPIAKVLESGKTISLNVELVNGTGTPLDYEMRYIPMQNSKNQVLTVLRNITASKEAQKELIKSMNELSLSNRELEQFAYTVSHDLQEPMRLVSSYLQLIKMKSRDQLDEKSSTYLAMAIQSSDQMRSLVTNLLEYSRLGHQKLKVKPIDFDRMLESIKLIFDRKFRETKGTIEIGAVPDFICDSLHFSLLLQNLIGNALKFRKKETPPHIHITGEVNEKGRVKICVADNGLGMKQETTEQVFGAFERLDGTAHIEGHGLGMSICRKIVHSHGGKIWIESELGKGTQVFFTMPNNESQLPTQD